MHGGNWAVKGLMSCEKTNARNDCVRKSKRLYTVDGNRENAAVCEEGGIQCREYKEGCQTAVSSGGQIMISGTINHAGPKAMTATRQRSTKLIMIMIKIKMLRII